MSTIKIIPLTINGEDAIKKYVDDMNKMSWTKKKTLKAIQSAYNKLGIKYQEIYNDNPIMLVIEFEGNNPHINIENIGKKVEQAIMKYGATKNDYKIEESS